MDGAAVCRVVGGFYFMMFVSYQFPYDAICFISLKSGKWKKAKCYFPK